MPAIREHRKLLFHIHGKIRSASPLKDQFLHELSERIFNADESVRFIGITDARGRLLGVAGRHGLTTPYSDRVIEEYTVPAVIKAHINERFEPVLGKPRYDVGVFERLITAVIPVSYNPKSKLFVFLTFELGAEAHNIIERKILPIIEQNRDFFM
jgi:hypothetical protein